MPDPVADAFATPPAWRTRTPCYMGEVLAQLDPPGRAAVEAALLPDSGWTGAAIARTLSSLGHPIKADNVTRHRRRLTGTGDGCDCPT